MDKPTNFVCRACNDPMLPAQERPEDGICAYCRDGWDFAERRIVEWLRGDDCADLMKRFVERDHRGSLRAFIADAIKRGEHRG